METFARADTTFEMAVIDTANLNPAGDALIVGEPFAASGHAAGHGSPPGLLSRLLSRRSRFGRSVSL